MGIPLLLQRRYMMPNKHHYYLASIRTWVTATDLVDAFIKFCDNTHEEEIPIVIVKVPLPMNSSYPINFYIPKVENCEHIYLYDQYFKTNKVKLAMTHQEMLANIDYAVDVIKMN